MPQNRGHWFRFDSLILEPKQVAARNGGIHPDIVLAYTCQRCGLRRRLRYQRNWKSARVDANGKDAPLKTGPHDECAGHRLGTLANLWTEDN